MWFSNSAKLKYLVYHRKNSCGYKLLNKYCTYNHNHCREHQNLSTLVANTIENIKFKIVRNSHLLLHNIGIFSSAMAIVTQTSINCSYAKTSKQQLTAHTSIVRVNHNKVLQTHMSFFLQMHTIIFHWCYKV